MNFLNEYAPHVCGIFPNVPEATYRQAPGINISSLKNMSKSPAHYKAALDERKDTPALQFGRLLHEWVLLDQLNFVTKPEGMKFTTKEGKEWRDKQTLPILDDEQELAIGQCKKNILQHQAAKNLLFNSNCELSVFWHLLAEDGTPVFCKGRCDIVNTDNNGFTWIADIKTTDDASREGFARNIAKYGYDQQAAFYLDLLQADNFVFICVEKQAPYAVGVYRLDSDSVAEGRAKYRRNLQRLIECEKSGQWPAYADTIETIELPRWARFKEAA